MKTYKAMDTYVDTLGIRITCNSKHERDYIHTELLAFIHTNRIAVTHYDEKNSSRYYQTTVVQSGNTTLATISRGYYDTRDNSGREEYYYVNIKFYGLKRYNNTKDTVTALLVQKITAHLNTNSIYFTVTELDVAMDIKSTEDTVLAVCVNRSSNVDYYKLGNADENSDMIQENKGTYYIEKYGSKKKRARAVSRAYLYDKRKKELDKYNRNIGFALTRFEVKLQKKFFATRNYSDLSIYKKLSKYAVLQFENVDDKAEVIVALNGTVNSKQRKKVIADVIQSGKAIICTPKMYRIGDFLRMIDTIKIDASGRLTSIDRNQYLWYFSRFNRGCFFR